MTDGSDLRLKRVGDYGSIVNVSPGGCGSWLLYPLDITVGDYCISRISILD